MKKLSFLILLALLIGACNNTQKADETDHAKEEAAVPAKIQYAVIEVSGMHCNGCVNTVTTKLTELDGVETADVSLENEQAIVKFDANKLNEDDFKNAVGEAGYSAVGVIIADKIEKQEAGDPAE